MAIYRVPKPYQSEQIYLYRFEGNARTFHSMRALPDDYKAENFETEEQLILAWMEFAEGAFKGPHAESSLKCWGGHYEQFGRVMLELVRLSDKRVSNVGYPAALIDSLIPERDDCTGGYWQPEERDWYRAWFSLLGHPHFQIFEGGVGVDVSSFRDRKYMLGIAIEEVASELRLLES